MAERTDFKLLKNLQNNIILWVQAQTGLSVGFVISLAVAGGAAVLAFVFLCVTGYAWLSIQLGPVFGGLVMTGVFLLIAVLGGAASALARGRTRQRAVLERAARAQGTSALINPKVLNVAMQAGRALGWQRLIPLALLGFLAAQWVQEARRGNTADRVK
jgi:hypothetical protein